MSNVSPRTTNPKPDVIPAEPADAIPAGEAQTVLREAFDAAMLAFDRLEALSMGIARARRDGREPRPAAEFMAIGSPARDS